METPCFRFAENRLPHCDLPSGFFGVLTDTGPSALITKRPCPEATQGCSAAL
jgi:hypothetical protein